MKTTLLAILLLISSISYSQLNTTASVGYGLRMKSIEDTVNYQVGLGITEGYKYKDFDFGVLAYTILSNTQSLPRIYTGARVTYLDVLKNEGNPVSVSGHWLYASQGYQLIGGDINYGLNDTWSAGLRASQEYKLKEFFAELYVQMSLIK